MGDVKSSHCNARFTLAKAYNPLGLCSCSRLVRASWGMTLDTKEELLLTMLLLGFRLLSGSLLSFPFKTASAALPDPNAGAWRPSRGGAVEPLPLTLWEPESLA